jgi:hypothetical protein
MFAKFAGRAYPFAAVSKPCSAICVAQSTCAFPGCIACNVGCNRATEHFGVVAPEDNAGIACTLDASWNAGPSGPPS